MSTTYEATGTIIFIGETQQIKETFRKRAFVIEVGDGNYPQEVQFEVTKDNCQQLDNYKLGDTLRVLFNLRGRKWDKGDGSPLKWFNTLEAWKIEQQGQRQLGDTDKTEQFDDVPF